MKAEERKKYQIMMQANAFFSQKFEYTRNG